MALLETIQKKLLKTGALEKILRLLPRLTTLLTIFSIVFILTLPMEGQHRNTYISENALMPSQAYSFFRESEWNFVRGYRNEILEHVNDPLDDRNELLASWLSEIGYKTSILNYTDPATGIMKPTLYAIYHVPKGDDTEAMVLVAPWYTTSDEQNIGGVSVALALARYFHRLSIWAKNIIIVFPEDSEAVLRNWVDAYHTSLDHTGGSIESAVVVDFASASDYIGYVEVEYVGLNGQLPNLDLVNCAAMISEHEGFKVSVNGTPMGQLWADDYSSRVTALIKGIFKIAGAGVVKGSGCESFSGWNVQSITLRAVGDEGVDITTYGRIVEAVFRSVNNLLEKFHQSFFFYLLLGPRLFVSIGMYLPAGGLLAGAFILGAINALVGGCNINNWKKGEVIGQNLGFGTKPLMGALCTGIFLLLVSIIFGLSMMQINNYEYWTYNGFLIPSLLLALSPILTSIVGIRYGSSIDMADYCRALNLVALFYFGYTLVAMMVLDFSLSFVVGLCASTLCLIRYGPKSLQKTRLLNTLFLTLSCPAVWLVVFGTAVKFNFDLDRVRNFIQYFDYGLLQKEIQNTLDFFEILSLNDWISGPVELFQGLVTGYENYQSWTWLFVCISWLTTWMCMIIVASVDIKVTDVELETEKKIN